MSTMSHVEYKILGVKGHRAGVGKLTHSMKIFHWGFKADVLTT